MLEEQGGGRYRKAGPSAYRALPAKMMGLDFTQWEEDMTRSKRLLLARHHCFVSQRTLMFSSHA